VDPTDKVVATHMTVSHQCPPVQTAAIKNGDYFVKTYDDKIDFTDDGVLWFAVSQSAEF
jgi:hypothetical protein